MKPNTQIPIHDPLAGYGVSSPFSNLEPDDASKRDSSLQKIPSNQFHISADPSETDESALHLASHQHDDLPETVLIHKCTVGKMQYLIDQFRAYKDPSISKYNENGSLDYHRGRCATIINRNEPFVKTYSKETAVGKPLFGLILNHENMIALLASSRNLASHSAYHSDRIVVKNDQASYKGHRKFFSKPRTLINYDSEEKELIHDAKRIMEKYNASLAQLTLGKKSGNGNEIPKTRKNGKIIIPNELLVTKKDDEVKTCIGAFVDLVSHDDMTTRKSINSLLQNSLLQKFFHQKPEKRKGIFESCFEKNILAMRNYQGDFDTLKTVCNNNFLDFYVRNLDANGKPKLQKMSLESLESFDDFLSACHGEQQPGAAR